MRLPLSQRTIGISALVLPIWFAAVYLVMSSLRPEYRHLTKAISELGSVDAPRGVVWNVLGYIVPGLGIALLGFGIRSAFADDKRVAVPAFAVVATGLLMSLSGVFPGDFENRTSLTMLLHTIASLGSFVTFLVAGFTLPRVLRSRAGFRSLAPWSLALVWASILTGFLRSGQAPGLGQRLGFACVFLWVGLMGYGLFRDGDRARDEGDGSTA